MPRGSLPSSARPDVLGPASKDGFQVPAKKKRGKSAVSEESPTNPPASVSTPFSEAFRQILNPGGEGKGSRNRALKTQIRNRLGVSDTTLYFWQNPGKSPPGRKPMKPSAKQVVQLAMAIADQSKGENRAGIVNHWLALAGYDPDKASETKVEERDTTAAQLKRIFADAQRVVAQTILSEEQRERVEITPLVTASFFSQSVTSGLLQSWISSGEGGHAVAFWRWHNGSLLKRIQGVSLEAFQKLFALLSGGGVGAGIAVSIFIVMDDYELEAHEVNTLKEHFAAFGDHKPEVYIESFAPGRPQHLGDVWLFMSPSRNYPFLITEYENVFNYLLTLPQAQQESVEQPYNPFSWAENSMLLDSSIIPRFLRDRRISPPQAGKALKFTEEKRWTLLGPF